MLLSSLLNIVFLQILQKQQILEELQRVEKELQEKAHAQMLLTQGHSPQTIQSLTSAAAELSLSDPSIDKLSNQQLSTAAQTLQEAAAWAASLANFPDTADGSIRQQSPPPPRRLLAKPKTKSASKLNNVEVEKNLKNVAESSPRPMSSSTSSSTPVTPSSTPPSGQLLLSEISASLQKQDTLQLLYQHAFSGDLSIASNQTSCVQQQQTQATQTVPLGASPSLDSSSHRTSSLLPQLTSQQLQVIKNQLAAAAAATVAGQPLSSCALNNPTNVFSLGPPVFPVPLNLTDQAPYTFPQQSGLSVDSTGQFVTSEDVPGKLFS